MKTMMMKNAKGKLGSQLMLMTVLVTALMATLGGCTSLGEDAGRKSFQSQRQSSSSHAVPAAAHT